MQGSAVRESAPVDLRDLLTLLWRRKWTVAAVAAVVLAAALLFSLLQTPIYESKASVLVAAPASASPGGTRAGPNMATEKLVASSLAVARDVVDALHLSEQPDDLLKRLSVDVPVDTEILDFTFADRSPKVAQQGAQAFAGAYLEYRQEKLERDTRGSRATLQDQIGKLEKDLESVSSRGGATASLQVGSINSQIFLLRQKLAELSVNQDVPAGDVVQDAPLPSRPARPNYPLNGALGIAVGLMLGVGVVVLREYLGDRIQGPKDLESQIGAPVLSAIPAVRTRGPATERLVTMQRPNSLAAEAFRHLRANFVIAAATRGAKTILITSAREQEGKTFTTANLGVVLAKAGMKVILLSADLRRPQLEQLFGFSAPVGFTDALADGSGSGGLPAAGMWSVDVNLTLVSLGTAPDNATELLGSSNMAALVKQLRDVADFVLIDAAPLLATADAATLAPACDAVLIVADAHSGVRARVNEAREQLERVQTPVLGAVLVNAPANGLRTYGPA
jgi:polysaccharide biosynthesis transport protein